MFSEEKGTMAVVGGGVSGLTQALAAAEASAGDGKKRSRLHGMDAGAHAIPAADSRMSRPAFRSVQCHHRRDARPCGDGVVRRRPGAAVVFVPGHAGRCRLRGGGALLQTRFRNR